jgi:hypothetical protein
VFGKQIHEEDRVEERRPVIGQLVFESNGSVLPQDGLLAGLPNLFYHLEDFENVIDLLRNEKPVFLSFTGPGFSNENGINTSAEPIGETEN